MCLLSQAFHSWDFVSQKQERQCMRILVYKMVIAAWLLVAESGNKGLLLVM